MTIVTSTVHVGDALAVLKTLPASSVHCCVTSPPYWGLRDYGTAQWEGGDAGCDHRSGRKSPAASTLGGGKDVMHSEGIFRDTCGKCGAKRIDRQIGQEPTPDAYVATLVEVFREVRRVLHDSGTVFLNCGDSYFGGGRGGNPPDSPHQKQATNGGSAIGTGALPSGAKPKDLCLIPWRLAIALQADGWWVRSVICWAKKSCMPESVTDRPTNSWEPIFLLAKSAKYFYDAEAVKEPNAEVDRPQSDARRAQRMQRAVSSVNGKGQSSKGIDGGFVNPSHVMQAGATRNQRNVWHLGPEPYAEAHFATFPTEIPRRAILAGTSMHGCCPQCRAPWARVVERSAMEVRTSEKGKAKHDQGLRTSTSGTMTKPPETRTVGWKPGCDCNAGEPIPCTVLDPFAGAGTTGVVAAGLMRHFIGIELNPQYAEMARRRIAQSNPLFARSAKP